RSQSARQESGAPGAEVLRIEIPDIAHRREAVAHMERVGARHDTLRRAMAQRDDQIVGGQIERLDRERIQRREPTVARAAEREAPKGRRATPAATPRRRSMPGTTVPR